MLDPPQALRNEHPAPPDFIGVGAQKCGTSWWYTVIASHPAVHHARGTHKERHFFDRFYATSFDDESVRTYHQWFPRPSGMLCGEWTPAYMFQPWTPSLLRRSAPDARLLVLLRDPIERYRSGLTHHAARSELTDSRVATEALLRGKYADQLNRLLGVFPSDQLLILQYEACHADPPRWAGRTFDFLNLDPEVKLPTLHERVSETKIQKFRIPDDHYHLLTDFYRDDVLCVAQLAPHLDLERWTNFRNL